jgi:hypothetical protein
MALFYHIERSAATGLKRGCTCSTTWPRNRYTKELFAQDTRVEVRGSSPLSIDAILDDHYSATSLGHARRMKKGAAEPEHLAQLAVRVLRQQATVIREYVFEEVRAKDFPNKPSRMRGIWLLPHDLNVLEMWCASKHLKKFRAWEIEVSGKLHYGDTQHLEPFALGGAAWAEIARLYWSQPVLPNSMTGEMLFEGEFTPVQEIKLATSRPTMWDAVKQRIGLGAGKSGNQ